MFEEAGCLVRYLPPYSPDFNPIELTFNILKAWMRKNWVSRRGTSQISTTSCGYALEHSKCDRFAKEQFRLQLMVFIAKKIMLESFTAGSSGGSWKLLVKLILKVKL